LNPFTFFTRLRARRAAEAQSRALLAVQGQAAAVARAARDAADQARDACRWSEAAALYRVYLAQFRDDAPLWVQLGHALKEAGDLPGAEEAYRLAARIAPRDHDIALQLGHVLKLQGRMEDATAAYALSNRLAPINHAARELAALVGSEARSQLVAVASHAQSAGSHEPLDRLRRAEAELALTPDDPAAHRTLSAVLLQSGRREPAIAAANEAFSRVPERRNWQAIRRAGGLPPVEATPGGPHLYDVTDLLVMVRDTGRATGIQRVQLGLAQGILADLAADEAARFVFVAERFGPLWTLSRSDVLAIIAYCLHEPHDSRRAEALVTGAMESACLTHLPSARLFFIMGAFWFWVGAPAALARLRAAGLRIGVLVYDLIPLTHPEHTSDGTVNAFRQGLEEAAGLWDFALTISEFTAGELRREWAKLEAPAIPIRPMPLAHRINPPEPVDQGSETGTFAQRAFPPGAFPPGVFPPRVFPRALKELRGKDYVLCVGTIESRKNHAALFQAWQIMLREGVDPPPLVIVGRPGWRVTDLMDQLEATRFLDGRIRLVHGVSDPELDALYRGCLFSVFPSFTEGWGLPVGESLALGKVCLAAMEGATPEAADGFAEPIDAFSPRDIAARIRHFLTDRAALAAAEARLRAGFTPRGWPDVTRHFLAELADCMAEPPPQRPQTEWPRLVAGDRLVFSPETASLPAGASLTLGEGFAPPEPPGAWLIGPSGTIHLESVAPLTLLVHLQAVPWAQDNRAGLAVGDAPLRWVSLEPGQTAMLALPIPAGPVTLRLVLDGPQEPPPGGEARPIRVALREICAVAHKAEALVPGRPVVFGPAATDHSWFGLLAEGWDHAADAAGVAPLAQYALLRFRVPPDQAGNLHVLLHFAIWPGGAGRLRHPGGATELPQGGGRLLLPLTIQSDATGTAEIALEMEDGQVPPLRLSALQWAAEGNVAARLAMIEAVILPQAGRRQALPPERLRAIEAELRADAAQPQTLLPGGDAGRAALRLSGRGRD